MRLTAECVDILNVLQWGTSIRGENLSACTNLHHSGLLNIDTCSGYQAKTRALRDVYIAPMRYDCRLVTAFVS